MCAMVAAVASMGGVHTTGLIEDWTFYKGFDNSAGILVPGQPNRPFLALIYKLGYTITPDSFIGLNILHGLVLIAKGLLFYAVLRRCLPGVASLPVCAASAILLMLYPADTGLVNSRYASYQVAVTAYLAAVLALQCYWTRPSATSLLAMQGALLLSLGTYEAGLPLIVATPFVIAWAKGAQGMRFRRIAVIWYPIPVLAACALLFTLTLHNTYVSGLTRLQPEHGVARWIVYAKSVVHAFWRTICGGWVEAWGNAAGFWDWPYLTDFAIGIAAFLALVACMAWSRASGSASSSEQTRRVVGAAIVGLLMLGLGFLPFVPTPHRWIFERTMMFASLGGVLAIVCLAWLVIAIVARSPRLFAIVVAVATGVSVASAVAQRDEIARYSFKEQRILSALAQQVPVWTPNLPLLVLDPERQFTVEKMFAGSTGHFGDAVRYLYRQDAIPVYLCYPDGRALGTYFEGCVFDTRGVTTLVQGRPATWLPLDRLLVFEYTPTGDLRLLRQVPESYLTTGGETYRPERWLNPGPPPARVHTLFASWPVGDEMRDRKVRASFSTDFDRQIDGNGWSPPEGSRTWMTSPSASIRTRLRAGNDYEVTFRVTMGIAPDVLASLHLDVNGQPVVLAGAQDPDGAWIFRGSLPGAIVARDDRKTTLQFSVNRVVTPKSLGINEDTRTLAIQFDWLRVEPQPS
jgi:hypothetical protein